MKKLIFLSILTLGISGVVSLKAQDKQKQKKVEIISESDEDVKLEIRDGQVYIDGKKVIESESEKDKDGKIVHKKIIINGKELDEHEAQAFDMGRGYLFNFDENDKKPMLGVSTKATKDNDGAEVENVVPNSPAQKMGLQQGDVITRVNDKNIYSPKDLVDAIAAFKPGNEIEVTYERDNKFLTKNVVLKGKNDVTTFRGTMPFNEELFRQFGDGENPFLMNPYRNHNPYFNDGPKIGLSVEERAEGKGVNVLEVTDNSAARKAGIEKHDVITAFDNREIANVDDLLDAIADAKGKDKVNMDIIRSGVKRQIALTMPKNLKRRDL